MTDFPGRVLLVLASLDLERAELRALATWIEKHGAKRFMSRIEILRRAANDPQYAGFSPPPDRAARLLRATSEPSDFSEKVERLLVDELGLSRQHASELLRYKLINDLGVGDGLPELARSSFRAWVDRIARSVPQSVILHAATRIKQEVGGRQPIADWPLKRSGDE